MSTIKIISEGQTGVDRVALDVAIEPRVEYSGCYPKDDGRKMMLSMISISLLKGIVLIISRQHMKVRDSDATLTLQYKLNKQLQDYQPGISHSIVQPCHQIEVYYHAILISDHKYSLYQPVSGY